MATRLWGNLTFDLWLSVSCGSCKICSDISPDQLGYEWKWHLASRFCLFSCLFVYYGKFCQLMCSTVLVLGSRLRWNVASCRLGTIIMLAHVLVSLWKYFSHLLYLRVPTSPTKTAAHIKRSAKHPHLICFTFWRSEACLLVEGADFCHYYQCRRGLRVKRQQGYLVCPAVQRWGPVIQVAVREGVACRGAGGNKTLIFCSFMCFGQEYLFAWCYIIKHPRCMCCFAWYVLTGSN